MHTISSKSVSSEYFSKRNPNLFFTGLTKNLEFDNLGQKNTLKLKNIEKNWNFEQKSVENRELKKKYIKSNKISIRFEKSIIKINKTLTPESLSRYLIRNFQLYPLRFKKKIRRKKLNL